jgi:hypothetical protein
MKLTIQMGVVDLLDAEPLAGEDGRDIDLLSVHADAAAGGDDDVTVVEWMCDLQQAVVGSGGG